MTLAGRVLRPGILRVALLLLALPIIVLAIDAFARARRAGVRLGLGVRAVGWRIVPGLAALAAAHLLVAPRPAARHLGRGAAAALGRALRRRVGRGRAAGRRRRRPRGPARPPPGRPARRGGSGRGRGAPWSCWPCCWCCCGGPGPTRWSWRCPRRTRRCWPPPRRGAGRWPRWPSSPSCRCSPCARRSGRVLDRGPVFAAWYLLETAASGARGAWGPIAFCAVAGTIWALGALVVFRARKGLVVAAGPSPAEERGVSSTRSG